MNLLQLFKLSKLNSSVEMRLKKIIENLDIVKIINFKNYNITSVTHISQDVCKGGLFFAISGGTFDGNDFAIDAIKKGAKCIITEECGLDVVDATLIVVKDIRKAMSIVGYNYYNRCVDKLKIIGVVGTSGKTSTSIIISQILSINDRNIGVIGTNGIFIGNIREDNKFTTPDPLELHYVFYKMKMLGVKTVIMEVSAQAIYFKKVYGVHFDICVFTNISAEHLDFFGSMEKYAKVKMNFFNKNNMKECVVNIDDFYGRELAYKVDMPCVSYGVGEPANSFAVDVDLKLNETHFFANIMDDVIAVDVPLVGIYNVYNILAGLSVGKLMGLTREELQLAVRKIGVIDGRFNCYNIHGKEIIIDFAHTPESIDSVLQHIHMHSEKKIISLFGCVGYSDREKRIDMAEAVAKYSSSVIVTTDNRGETEFSVIANDMVCGLKDIPYKLIEDRTNAIKYAYENMGEDDILVILGKGAENFQTIGKERVPFSDRECVLKLAESDV